MKKFKKIMFSLAVMMLVIPLAIGLAACGDKGNELDADGNATATSPIIGTWEFATNDNYITEIHVAVGQVTLNFSGLDPVAGVTKNASVSANGGGTTSVTVNTDNFQASQNNPNANINPSVWSISGSIVNGKLVITGTITTLGALGAAQGDVSLTSK